MRRLVLVVSAIVFVDTTFYAVVAPLLPEYADDHGLSKASAGALLAAYPAGTLLGALPSGVLAGRIGARPTVLLGLLLLGTSSLGFAVADTELTLDLSRFVQGIGGACSWAGGMAWIVGAAPAERRGELIGVALSAAIGGALLGPVVGATAAAVGTTPVFASAAVLASLLAVAAARVPEVDVAAAVGGTTVRDAVRAPGVRTAMWLVALPGLGFGAVDVLVPLRMHDLGAGATVVAGAFLVAAAGEALISPLVGRLSDRRGRHVPIRAGLLAAAVLVVLLPLPGAALATGGLLVLVTAALGAFWAPAMALLSDAAEAVGAHQGLAFGLVNLAWATGMVVGSAGGSAFAKATSDELTYVFLAALCLATLAALLRAAMARSPVDAAALRR